MKSLIASSGDFKQHHRKYKEQACHHCDAIFEDEGINKDHILNKHAEPMIPCINAREAIAETF